MRNRNNPRKYNFLKYISDLCLFKKIIVVGIISNRLSYRTKDEIPRITNEQIMFVFLSLKNNDKKDTIKKINNESVIPNNEFSIMYGENRKKHAPTIAISCLKNFLARKYIGITVNNEKIIEHILCSVI
tara:strand:+ start:578 stop:964 length:387 start_codon:yes stop_codon:yes gene_type:complete